MLVETDRPRARGSHFDPRGRLLPGDAAPDVIVLDSSGRNVSLAEIWRRGPVVLTFLRHFG